MTTSTKIVKLTAQNFKVLKAVEITPDGNLVVIGGRNGQGKTSVLDCITAALGGVNNKALPMPIREGEDSAQIILELEDLIVTRRFTDSGSTVVVSSKDGAKYPRGQAMLDSLLGKLSLDPLAFIGQEPKDQRDTLLGLVKLPFDPAVLDARRKRGFDARTELKRDLVKLAAQVEAAPDLVDGELLEIRSVAALVEENAAAQSVARRVLRARQEVESGRLRYNQLVEQLRIAEEDLLAAETEETEVLKLAAESRSLTEIAADLNGIEDHNAMARAQQATLEVVREHGEVAAKVAQYTAAIETIDAEKAAGLKAAEFPGGLPLGFNETGVLLNGIPFKQASGAEQLRTSLAIAMALNPALRVIRISDGSLLDSDNLKLVADMAAEHDFQVWLEVVGTGAGGIIIEDGSVA